MLLLLPGRMVLPVAAAVVEVVVVVVVPLVVVVVVPLVVEVVVAVVEELVVVVVVLVPVSRIGVPVSHAMLPAQPLPGSGVPSQVHEPVWGIPMAA